MPGRKHTPEEFVRAWQESSSPDEARQRLGYKSISSLTQRAVMFRKLGVKLKYFSARRARIDVKRLNQIVEEVGIAQSPFGKREDERAALAGTGYDNNDYSGLTGAIADDFEDEFEGEAEEA